MRGVIDGATERTLESVYCRVTGVVWLGVPCDPLVVHHWALTGAYST